MAKRMLIDATHPEETRVVVVNGTRLEQFDVETSTKKQLKGNIYLAKVIRVEPSLQAAFVDYGGNRHGFLAFSEIHPDYYQIPVADRQALLEAEAAQAEEHQDDDEAHDVETVGGDDAEEAPTRARRRPVRDYKIQEVIKRRQIMLVQVVKEERGTKGAALTTYLSLAGRYCVLMPNTARGGGVSRKITSLIDRKRLKAIMQDLDVPPHMAVILRTAGQERSKAEIKRDYEYLIRTWNQIRETTLASRAPSLIHEEGNLIKRAIRDVYTSDIEDVIVDGEEGYRNAKDFMKLLTPSHAKKVQPYKDEAMPLFQRYQVDAQLDAMHSPSVHLRSGGYIVINQTEALVAIDVNSGRATKERHIEETALKTNLEAAEEVARQLRLRDLAGLIVIDFIDMEEGRNNAAVERRLKEALKQDRARIQVGRISPFGLLELSRQRLRPSLMETSFHVCPHCGGTGMVRSVESSAVYLLRVIEEEGVRRRSSEVTIWVATPVALYILNHKRKALADIEHRYGFTVMLHGDDSLISPEYRMERVRGVAAEDGHSEDGETPSVEKQTPPADDGETEVDVEVDVEDGEALGETNGTDGEEVVSGSEGTAEGNNGRKRRKRRKRRRRPEGSESLTPGGEESTEEREDSAETEVLSETDAQSENEESADLAERSPLEEDRGDGDSGEAAKRRRRSRRGGRRRRRSGEENVSDVGSIEVSGEIAREDETVVVVDVATSDDETDEDRADERIEPDLTQNVEVSVSMSDAQPEAVPSVVSEAEEAPRRRVRRKKSEDVGTEATSSEELSPESAAKGTGRRRTSRKKTMAVTEAASDIVSEGQVSAEDDAVPAKKPTRSRRSRTVKAADVEPIVESVGDAGQDAVEVLASEGVALQPAEAEASGPKPVVVMVEPAADAPKRRGWWSK